MSPKPQPPRAPSRPEIIDLTPETPVRNARRWDDPKPVDLPPPPAVPGEFQQTLPSPASTPDQASTLALRKRAEEAEKRAREAEARAELVAKRAPVTTAPGSDPLGDEAIGKLVKAVVSALTKRFGAPLVLAASVAGGGLLFKTATEKPSPPPLTAAQFDERVGKLEEKVTARLDTLTSTTNDTVAVSKCLRKKTNQIGESLLPAPDKMGPARRPSAYEDDCPDSPKALPEPK